MSTDDNWPDYSDDASFDEHNSRREPQDPWSDELYPPEKPGMSTGMKVLILLLCLGGGIMLLCCGGVVYFISQIEVEQNNPAAAAATAAEIVSIEVPDQFRPSDSMKMELPFGLMRMKLVAYKSTAGRGELGLIEMQIANVPMQQQEGQFRQQLQQQGINSRQLIIKEQEPREFKIRGRAVTFLFAEAKDAQSGTAFRQVSGTFPGKGGTAFLLLQVEEDSYDEDAVVKMIESIK